MRKFIFASVALLIVGAIIALLTSASDLAQLTSAIDPAQIAALLSALPLEQLFAICFIGLVVFGLIGSAIWQAERLAQQDNAIRMLEDRLNGVREATSKAEESQRDAESAFRALANSDPERNIASLQKRLTGAERRTSVQHGRTEAVDMQDRVEEIRRRQKALRQQIGEVLERRRVIEPIFGELKERQRQLEHWLAAAESDDSGGTVADRVSEFNEHLVKAQTRLKAIEDSRVALSRLKDDLSRSQADLVPLQRPDSGITTLISQVTALRDRLNEGLGELESGGDVTLSARVEALLNSKRESDQRLTGLSDCVATIQTIRNEFAALMERQAIVARSLAEAEADDRGRSITDQLNEFNDFATQARVRFEHLEITLTSLKAIKEELVIREADLALLQKPEGGIGSVIGEVRLLRDRLIKILDELESDGGETLPARVEAFSRSRQDAQLRIAALTGAFAELGAVRKDIGALFKNLSATLATHMALSIEDK